MLDQRGEGATESGLAGELAGSLERTRGLAKRISEVHNMVVEAERNIRRMGLEETTKAVSQGTWQNADSPGLMRLQLLLNGDFHTIRRCLNVLKLETDQLLEIGLRIQSEVLTA